MFETATILSTVYIPNKHLFIHYSTIYDTNLQCPFINVTSPCFLKVSIILQDVQKHNWFTCADPINWTYQSPQTLPKFPGIGFLLKRIPSKIPTNFQLQGQDLSQMPRYAKIFCWNHSMWPNLTLTRSNSFRWERLWSWWSLDGDIADMDPHTIQESMGLVYIYTIYLHLPLKKTQM